MGENLPIFCVHSEILGNDGTLALSTGMGW